MTSMTGQTGHRAGASQRVAAVALFALALGLGRADAPRAQGAGLLPDAVYAGVGVSHIATDALDQALAAEGYPTYGRTAVAVTLGGTWHLAGGVALGGEWHGLILGADAQEGREVGLGGGYATIGVGYAVELSPRVRVTPRLGLGVGGLGWWVESEGEEVGFDEVLADPRPPPKSSTVLNRGSVMVDLGAGVDLSPGGEGLSPLLGLRLGYLAAPLTTGWTLNDRPVVGGPEATGSGPYVRVVVGLRSGGGRRP